MKPIKRLTDAELAQAKYNRLQGEASLACEGLYLDPESKALFDRFEEERLPHEERLKLLIEYHTAIASAGK